MLFKKIEHVKTENPLISELESTKQKLQDAYNKFELASEPELIDSCIYELQAVQIRYCYLLGLIRSNQDNDVAS